MEGTVGRSVEGGWWQRNPGEHGGTVMGWDRAGSPT